MLVVGVVIIVSIFWSHIYPALTQIVRQVLPGLEPSRIAATQLRRSKLKPKRGLPKVPSMICHVYLPKWSKCLGATAGYLVTSESCPHTFWELRNTEKHRATLACLLGAHSPCDSSSAPNIIGGQNWVPKKLVPMALITCLNNLVWFNAIRFWKCPLHLWVPCLQEHGNLTFRAGWFPKPPIPLLSSDSFSSQWMDRPIPRVPRVPPRHSHHGPSPSLQAPPTPLQEPPPASQVPPA